MPGLRHGTCPRCGEYIIVHGREHEEEGPQCVARQTQARFFEKGYVPVPAERTLKVMRACGVALEEGPGGWHLERLDAATMRHRMVSHSVWFAPKSAVALLHALLRIRNLSDDFRHRALRALWSREDIGDALTTIAALGGDVRSAQAKQRSFIHRLTVAAEEEQRAERIP